MPPLPPSPEQLPPKPITKITVVSTSGEDPQNKSIDSKQGKNHRAVITARIDSAIQLYPRAGVANSTTGAAAAAANSNDNDGTNRSADLIQLQKEFQEFRKKLKELVIAAKLYPSTLTNADKARLDLIDKLKQLAIQSPMENIVVHGNESSTVSSIMQKASQHVKTQNQDYQQYILRYILDWESTVTTRIDALTKENHKIHTRLDHYRTKVTNLRKNANKKMEAAAAKATAALQPRSPSTSSPVAASPTTTGIPIRLQEKLKRNEGKLDQSWKIHQRLSTNLCHVLEETTRQGWQELVPLLLEYLQWEMKRTTSISDTMIALASISQSIQQTFESERAIRLEYLERRIGTGDRTSTTIITASSADASRGEDDHAANDKSNNSSHNHHHDHEDSEDASILTDEVDDEDDSSEEIENV